MDQDILLSGATAGITVNLLLYPLDTLKTRLQSPNFQTLYQPTSKSLANPALYRGVYQGIGTILLVSVPSSGVFFTTYEGLKRVLSSTTTLPQPVNHAIASSVAQIANCAIVAPAEVVKQNAQVLGVSEGASEGRGASLRVLREMMGQPRRLWRGYTALVARDLPFTALQFPMLEYFKELFTSRRARARQNLQNSEGRAVNEVLERARIMGMSASTSGSIAAWLTTPVDVVKTRMMLDKTYDGTRKGALEIGKEVLREDGIRGLFRGAAIRTVWTALGSGCFIGMYDGARSYLGQRREDAVAKEHA